MTTDSLNPIPRKCGFWKGHEWTQWERFQVDGQATYIFRSLPVSFTKVYQRRTCKNCGYMQQEEIKI